MGLRSALSEFRELQAKHANYGASDTEPDFAFCNYLAEVLEGADVEPPESWDIFDHMAGADDVNEALSEAAGEAGVAARKLRKKLIWLQDELWRTALEWPTPTKEECTSPSVQGRIADRPHYTIAMPIEHTLDFAKALTRYGVPGEPKPSACGDLIVMPVKTTLAGIQQLVARLMACMQQRREMFTVEVLFD
jgi:hypothetical protein